MNIRFGAVAAILLCAGIACGRDTAQPAKPQSPPLSPEEVVSAILKAVAPSSAEEPSDSLFSEAPNCDQEYESDVLVFPAKFKITGSQLLHDTAVVHTQIVSVGERVANAANDSVVVRQITRTGEATWTLLRDAPSGRWQVCGDPRGVAVYFGVLDDLDTGVTWAGQASAVRLRASADSANRIP